MVSYNTIDKTNGGEFGRMAAVLLTLRLLFFMTKKIKTNRKHRVCRFVRCEQVLSIYNSEVYCHVHQQVVMARDASLSVLARR